MWDTGIGQGRITDNLINDIDSIDGAITIPDSKTIAMIYHLLHEDGLYLGASSAMNVVACQELAVKLGKGSRVVTILCDGAYRFVFFPLLLFLFAGVGLTEYDAQRRYQSRLFSRTWLESKKLVEHIPEHLQKYIVLP